MPQVALPLRETNKRRAMSEKEIKFARPFLIKKPINNRMDKTENKRKKLSLPLENPKKISPKLLIRIMIKIKTIKKKPIKFNKYFFLFLSSDQELSKVRD